MTVSPVLLLICCLVAGVSTQPRWTTMLLNRTDIEGIQLVDGWYWIYLNQAVPSAFQRIWLSGVISDELAASLDFTTVVPERFKILRGLVRYRVFRWIALIVVLKVLIALFVLVGLPNLYFSAMQRTDEMDMK